MNIQLLSRGGDCHVVNPASPRNLPIRPLTPFRILKHPHDGAAFVGVAAPLTVRGISAAIDTQPERYPGGIIAAPSNCTA
ncbi:MAG: hypothetical protein IIB62_09435 [Proteobacteria bacterium]|nr:hypothetical protein [Pseudomonadota bacterium]